jgi:hypothetical protein
MKSFEENIFVFENGGSKMRFALLLFDVKCE